MTPEEKAAEARKQADAQKELDRMREEMKDVAQQMQKLPREYASARRNEGRCRSPQRSIN